MNSGLSAQSLRGRLSLPAFCAPMFLVSTVDLVVAASRAGLVAGLPRHNARSIEAFDAMLSAIRDAIDRSGERADATPPGPLAVNLDTRLDATAMAAELAVCRKHGVEIIISAGGDPSALIRQVQDQGGIILHDATNMRFAERAIAAGADGVIAIAGGGGGQSGSISPLVFIPRLREMFDGIIVMAGAVTNGAAIRAAEILGADFAYLGTRFIATRESGAPEAYKAMLVSTQARDVIHTDAINGVPASWLKPSLERAGLDVDNLPRPAPGRRHGHLPSGATPWKTIWSASQGVELINDIPSVADLVERLKQEYHHACRHDPDQRR